MIIRGASYLSGCDEQRAIRAEQDEEVSPSRSPIATTPEWARAACGAMTPVLEKGNDCWRILNEHYSTKRP
jgi:hypothetical protein